MSEIKSSTFFSSSSSSNSRLDNHPCLNPDSSSLRCHNQLDWWPSVRLAVPDWPGAVPARPSSLSSFALVPGRSGSPFAFFFFLRVPICQHLTCPCDSSRPPSSVERRSQKPRSCRKRGRSWPLQRGSWSRRAARPQLGRRSSGTMRCVNCS